jgi:hypothetical protein
VRLVRLQRGAVFTHGRLVGFTSGYQYPLALAHKDWEELAQALADGRMTKGLGHGGADTQYSCTQALPEGR